MVSLNGVKKSVIPHFKFVVFFIS